MGSLGAAFQQIGGGNITIYTELAEHARQEAYDVMLQHAAMMGGNGFNLNPNVVGSWATPQRFVVTGLAKDAVYTAATESAVARPALA